MMTMLARATVAAAMFGFAAMLTPALADDLPRAASVSVCTDQYLLALADPEQVAAVSWQATSLRSPVRAQAAGLMQIRGTAEELIAARVSLVVFDPYGHQSVTELLPGYGLAVHRVGDVIRVQDVELEVARLGTALNRDAAGQALARTLRMRRLALEGSQPMSRPRALYVAPGGSGTGSDTYIDDALLLAGFSNLQAELGYLGWQRIPLEALVANPPDVLVLSLFSTADPSLQDGFARHPRFRALVETIPVIEVPAAPWVCAGPYVLDAVDYLRAERLRLFPSSDSAAQVRP